MPSQKRKATFIKPMLLLRTNELPEGAEWITEIKLDGYRALAIKTDRKLYLRSRNGKDFNARYPSLVEALSGLHEETVLDGEVVAFGETGKPSFNTLQNAGSSPSTTLFFYVFDRLMLTGKNVMGQPLTRIRGASILITYSTETNQSDSIHIHTC